MNPKFQQFRDQYPTFVFDSFKIATTTDALRITYNFEILDLAKFHPTLELPLENIQQPYDHDFLATIAFNLGMVEAISYYKAACSPTFIIKAGYLTDEQLQFFQKLYFYGLGEFLYLNNIETTEDELVRFKVEHEPTTTYIPEIHPSGNLITVGGGKDSCVSLELLRNFHDTNSTETSTQPNTCFALNPKQANLACIEASGYPAIYAKRTIDPELLRLNRDGFLNGHTPFSAMLAFTTYLVAYLTNRQYIVMSNEGSANEATVHGTKINHQYSKTYEFENDFNNYVSQFLSPAIHYFSFLRPLTEFQIGMIFARNPNLKKYHHIFKSCNVGSKDSNWNWCGECPKCLFVYIILSAFLEPNELIDIFGRDLYENRNLLQTFIELLGYSERKPFECVGTYEECRLAVSLAIQKLKSTEKQLPYLLQYYKDHYPLTFSLSCGCDNSAKPLPLAKVIASYNSENNLPPTFANIIKQELAKYTNENSVNSIADKIISKLTDKNILILGFGLEGQSTYRFLRRHLKNQPLTIADQNDLKNRPLLQNDKNLTLITGPNYLDNLTSYDLIIKTPGISFKNLDYKPFEHKITSQLELILEVDRENIIGVTGTKGKSTTSSLIFQILQNAGRDVRLLGNIGTPIFDEIENINPDTALVVEMSSHQLEFIRTSPHIGAILNLFEDHLDAAGSIEHYHWSKLNLFRHMTKNDLAIYCADNPALQKHILNDNFQAQLISVSINPDISANVELRDNQIFCHETPLYNTANPHHLLGQHNLENIMVALTIAHLLGVGSKISQQTINNFQPLEHRLEKVATINNITYYNDVIATIPAATINAIQSLENVDTLIFGGLDRGINYQDFIDFLNNSDIKHFICMPSTGHTIGKRLNPAKTHFVDTLEEAVALANKITRPNTICLLSPAAASYEFYKNFQEKGRAFKELVHQLTEQEFGDEKSAEQERNADKSTRQQPETNDPQIPGAKNV